MAVPLLEDFAGADVGCSETGVFLVKCCVSLLKCDCRTGPCIKREFTVSKLTDCSCLCL